MRFNDKVFEEQRGWLIFGALTCFFVGTTAIWLHLHRAPPQWDDSWYLTNSLVMFDALWEGGLFGYAKKFLKILGTKAPLITILPTPVYLIFGRNFRYAYAVNLIFMAVLFLAVYLIAQRSWNARAGLMAVYVAGTMPLLYGLSRWYLVECSLCGLVCLAIYFLVTSQDFGSLRLAFGFGVTCGFGLLLKVSFPLYVVFPFLYVFTRFCLRSPSRSEPGGSSQPSRPRTVLTLSLPAVLLPLPWYLFNFRRVIARAWSSGFSEEAALYGTGDVLSFQAIKTYLVHLANWGPSSYYTFLAILLFGILVITGKTREFLNAFPRETRFILFLWGLPFLVFLFGRNKDVRFVSPLLPAFALALAFALDFALDRLGKWKHVLMCLILAFPLASLFETSFGILGNWRATLGSFRLIAPDLGYAAVYDNDVWPQREILDIAYQRTRFKRGEKKLLVVGSDTGPFNGNNFELAAVEQQLPFKVESTAYENDLNALLSLVNSASFFVYKEGGEPEAGFHSAHLNAVLREVRENGKFVELPYGHKLPDGGIAHILQKLSPDSRLHRSTLIPEGLDQLPDCEVNFGNKIQLTGLSVTQAANLLEVKYRWRCVRLLDRDYWCFTHILDEQKNVIGFLDHPILGGEPPMTSWNPGDVALETLRFKLSPSQVGKKFHLKVGLFDMPSGERLSIDNAVLLRGAQLPVSDRDTALLVDGAWAAR